MRLTLKFAFLIFISELDFISAARESSEMIQLSLLPLTLKLISLLFEITIGRTDKLCGAIGVITKLSESGIMIGPPQLKEYAVDPVGVETISPSAKYEFKKIPSI